MIKNPKYISKEYRNFSYITRGIYLNQIKNWMKVFPKEQILIIRSEDFYKNPRKILNLVCSFINLQKYDLANYKAY
ncbi:MAG: sulfotransferase domain-containing protein [Candidatus Hodarchaeales archaeon]|jgi:hypothetical protein